MPDPALPPPWPEFLADVDRSLPTPVELHCVGGFVLAGVYGIPRTTNDLDYISADPSQAHHDLDRIAGRNSDLARKHKLFLQMVGVADYPENYASRLMTLTLGLTKLTLRVLEPHDLLLSKLTRNSPKDMQDVQALARKLDLSFEVMMQRFRTEMSWVPRREWHEQTLEVVWREYFARA